MPYISNYQLKKAIIKELIEDGISDAFSTSFPKVATKDNLPAVVEDGTMVLVMDVDRVFAFDGPTGTWKDIGTLSDIDGGQF